MKGLIESERLKFVSTVVNQKHCASLFLSGVVCWVLRAKTFCYFVSLYRPSVLCLIHCAVLRFVQNKLYIRKILCMANPLSLNYFLCALLYLCNLLTNGQQICIIGASNTDAPIDRFTPVWPTIQGHRRQSV